MSGSLIEYSEKGVGKGVREHHTGRICMLSVNFVIGHVHNNECHFLLFYNFTISSSLVFVLQRCLPKSPKNGKAQDARSKTIEIDVLNNLSTQTAYHLETQTMRLFLFRYKRTLYSISNLLFVVLPGQ